jgi:hypothetical protein
MKTLLLTLSLLLTVPLMAQTPPYLDENKPLKERVDDALQRMTPAEKETLAQTCFQPYASGVPRLGIPPFVIDTTPNPLFPSVASLLASWNPELFRMLGSYSAEQALYRRIDAIGDAIPPRQGEDPYLVGLMLPPYAEGVRAYGVAVMDDFTPIGAPQPQDERLRRLLELYLQTSMNRQRPLGFVGTGQQLAAARTMAEESVVLLKNDHGILPLQKGASCRIWMVGSHPMEGLRQALEQQGVQADCRDVSFEEATRMAGPGDIVVFTDNCSDRTETGFLQKVPAVLQVGELGAEGADVLANMLVGQGDPSGRLPFAWKGKDEKAPHFALGHGLGYTTFELSNITQSGREIPEEGDILVTVTVTNTGARAGATVVQCYIHDIKTSLPKPDRSLQGFKKVFLQPGEQQDVTFAVNVDSVLFYDEDSEAWVAEPGFYTAYIGFAMDDTPLKVRFHLK